jgi:hypothetical protein
VGRYVVAATGAFIARAGGRAISEKRLLVLQLAVDDDALDGGLA